MTDSDAAVVLLSGGLDSSTTLAIARGEGFSTYALTFRYGQRNVLEVAAASRIAKALGTKEHVILDIDLRRFGGSALTTDAPVPKGRTPGKEGDRIPATYVPARNTIFLSFALAWAEVIPSSNIFIGVNAVDYSGYPDCRPEFIQAFERLAAVATKTGVEKQTPIRIHAPLIDMTKADIVRRGVELGVDYGLTWSCYDPVDGKPCRACDACRLRERGFRDAGVDDPLR